MDSDSSLLSESTTSDSESEIDDSSITLVFVELDGFLWLVDDDEEDEDEDEDYIIVFGFVDWVLVDEEEGIPRPLLDAEGTGDAVDVAFLDLLPLG